MAKLKITQVRSRIGATARQKKNLDALGLRKMHQTVEHEDSAIIMGMIEKVKHLVKVEAEKESRNGSCRTAGAARRERSALPEESVRGMNDPTETNNSL